MRQRRRRAGEGLTERPEVHYALQVVALGPFYPPTQKNACGLPMLFVGRASSSHIKSDVVRWYDRGTCFQECDSVDQRAATIGWAEQVRRGAEELDGGDGPWSRV